MTSIETHSGATLSLAFTCKDENGDPFDLTGWSARGAVRPFASSSTVTLDLSPTIPTPSNGVVLISKSKTDTAAVASGDYVWGLVLDGPSNALFPVAEGPIKFRTLIPRAA